MSAAARQLLKAFDALPAGDREAVIEELLVRHPVGEGEVSDAGLTEIAEELFLNYAAAEAADAAPR